ncbi:DUF2147 domain-containing protein [Sphingomonas xanthus]|nr:DUF2147 domain-containing protein [Sphingomonas xanthus]
MTKARYLLAATTLALTVAVPAEARSPIEGRWQKGNLQIDIKPCGSALCGTVVRASKKQQARAEKGSGTDLIGATLIRDIRPTGPGAYSARVFVPDRNMNASGRIKQLAPNRLQVSGCVLAIICKSGNWSRVN